MSELIYSDDVILVMLGSKIRQTREGGVGQYHWLTGAWIVADKYHHGVVEWKHIGGIAGVQR